VEREVESIREFIEERSVREAEECERAAGLASGGADTKRLAAGAKRAWFKCAEGKQWLDARVDEELMRELISLLYEAQRRQAKASLGDSAGPDAVNAEAQTLRSALCLSGGGIRSATYNLGALQGLARHGLLDKFDYLSTVSGGGFIGGWLSAWVHRESLGEVVKRLSKRPASPLKPDPQPVEHLRVYSNFLSPQPGLLSADTWTLIASVLRNLLLTWLVFVPVLVALLLLPRMFVALVQHAPDRELFGYSIWLVVSFVAATWGFTYTGLALPTVADTPPAREAVGPESDTRRGWWDRWREGRGGQGRFIVFNLLPLVVSAVAAAVHRSHMLARRKPDEGLGWFVGFALLLVVIPFAAAAVKVSLKSSYTAGAIFRRLVLAAVCLFVAQVVTGYMLWVMTDFLPDAFNPAQSLAGALLYATFVPPAVLLQISLIALIIAGFTSRVTDDADQEWWARAGGWILIVCLVWVVGHLLVLYGPLLFIRAGNFLLTLWKKGGQTSLWELAKELWPVVAAAVSGAFTLLGGFSANTPANEKEARKAGLGGKLLNLLTNLLAPVFLAFILILVALGTNWLLVWVSSAGNMLASLLDSVVLRPTWLASGIGMVLAPLAYVFSWLPDWLSFVPRSLPDPARHDELLSRTPFGFLLFFAALVLLASGVSGRLINTNAFSLHHMWRDRIIRAYLGASRARRRPNRFTGFDPADNIQMHQLRVPRAHKSWRYTLEPKERFKNILMEEEKVARNPSGKLLHVVNVALNLAGGDKLAWQDRKAESMTVSPLHTGSYWLGYRRTWKYGSYGVREGISLGTAVAISGAFVSPNMGYMMTSPVVRFLMTLFNVRFGWWLGNPGRAGDDTYALERPLQWAEEKLLGDLRGFNLRAPRLAVLPIVEEAFGHTNDKSPYVYLSDGGHFENLGLYEMVLRRCRYIVVCDASTDAEYSFDSLAMSIRQIRVDFGIPIDLPDLSIGSPSDNFRNKYCAVGRIRYSCVDRDPHDPHEDDYYDGVLVYLKPALVGGEPRDVATYGLDNNSFPQEVIVDQWFSEPQFESYRELASHAVNEICGGDSNRVGFQEFRQKADEHNRLDFRAYREQVQYAAFEQLFKEGMGPVEPSTFKKRAAKFIKEIMK
jgi:hypothetical protein